MKTTIGTTDRFPVNGEQPMEIPNELEQPKKKRGRPSKK